MFSPRIISMQDAYALSLALSYLQRGEAIGFPTDTVYGIGVAALNVAAVSRLYTIKQRPLSSPIPVLLADTADIPQVARSLPDTAKELAHRYLPGAVSLVVPAAAHLPSILLANGDSVAVRVPNQDWLRQLIRTLGQPLATTSANLHGNREATSADEVVASVGESLALIVDGGTTPGAIPSTVVDCLGVRPRVLRQGRVQVEVG